LSGLPAHAEGKPQVDVAVPDGWFAKMSSNIRRAEYRFTPLGDDVWCAPNRSQDLCSQVGPDGVEVVSRGPGAVWTLRLETAAFGRAGEVLPLECRAVSVAGERAELDHGALIEWFVNDRRGLEQGWTIAERPAGDGALVIELRVEGDLSLRVDEGGRSGFFADETGEVRARYLDLVAWDSGGRELSVCMQSGSAGVELTVDDADAVYPVTVDPLMTSPAWAVESNQGSAWLGGSVSSAGDVNGDGYDDVIVGASGYDNGVLNNSGRVFVYHGSASGLATTESWTVASNQASSGFGSVAGAGDVNGDGYDDVIVGAGLYDNGTTNQGGRVWAYHGSATGLSTTEAWTKGVAAQSSRFGSALSTAGDVNGDGYDDVIVGAWAYGNGQNDEGRAYVFLGSATGLVLPAAWKMESNQTDARFGLAVSTAGDVNGDGYDDVIVTAPWYDNGHLEEGKAYVYHGSASGLSVAPGWTKESNQYAAYYGYSAAAAGDVNGDGFSDIIVGAVSFTNGEQDEGKAFVYHGSATGLVGAAAWTAESNQALASFGHSVSGAGDINGDGYSEVIVGADTYDGGEVDEGGVFLYEGSASGLAATEAWSAESNQAGAAFGSALACAGDVNGDGSADVIIGARHFSNPEVFEGAAFVYHGAGTVGPLQYCTAGTSASGCNAQISSAGVPSATATTGFSLITATVEGAKDGLYFFGSNGRQANSWGSGTSYQCVVPPVIRAGLLTAVGTSGLCDGSFSQDLNALWCSTCPKPQKNPGVGTLVQAQLWYRDPFNTSNQTTSISDAIEFTVAP
jgi:hypothetical protein